MLYRFAAGFYQYYLHSTKDIHYFRTVAMLSFMLFMHLVQIGIVFHIPPKLLFFWGPIENKLLQRLGALVYLLALFGLISLIFPKRKLEEVAFTEAQLKKWRRIVPWYIIVNIAILAGLLIKSGVDRGLIKI